MEKASLALRLRWLWFSKTDEGQAWHGLDMQFSQEECALFFASTTMIIGNGRTAKFWEDRWLSGKSVSEIAPHLHACIPKHRRKTRTVADGLLTHNWARDIQGTIGIQEIGEYLLLWHQLEYVQLTDQADTLVWKWTNSGIYSASSCYKATFHGSAYCDISHTAKELRNIITE
jgi:hypothetical protein